MLPGLIDCHTHIMLADTNNSHYEDYLLKDSYQYRTILAVLNVKKDLEAGFTAMRDVETEGAMYSDVDVRNAINQGLIPGPRLKVATRGISTTSGYALEGYAPQVTVPMGVQIVDGPYEARKAVREQFNYGADSNQDLRHRPLQLSAQRQRSECREFQPRRKCRPSSTKRA